MTDLTTLKLSEIDALLLEKGVAYREAEEAAKTAKNALDAAKRAWEEANKALIDAALNATTKADALKTELQQAATQRTALTGEKTWKAFQTAETVKPVYDAKALLSWALTQAPGQIRDKLVSLNTTAANALLLERRADDGTFRPFEGAPVPAVAYEIVLVGKIISKELALLALPSKEAVLTADFVAEQVKPVVSTPKPELDPIPF